ncbi:MAG: deoxyguanosinetriphosphate triphosphohydrolase [Oscillospiraceae bacterium]|nr:deoxyguanosinetriphosphate triphosphohydrolase [Oscillospiraceae bacterium]
MTIREQLEQHEKNFLAPQACKSTDKGAVIRLKPETPCPYRTEFQRDRDRILHCSAFRRLKHKTQVFLSPVGDHYRTRLTHTLEVSQVARTISRALFLNEDLTEAIALGHDMGHSPFGHAGEAVLNKICPHGYKHYEQSVRAADVIEQLNLTYAVRDGILCHTNRIASTPEGNIVRFADRIAYINHDIEDAIRAGVLTPESLPAEAVSVLGDTKSERITTLVSAIVEHGADEIGMNPEIQAAFDLLHDFMYANVYLNETCKREEKKAENLIAFLYQYFRKFPEKMPEQYQQIISASDIDRAVCDYISGMSDSYAVNLYSELCIPEFWK